MAHLQSSLLYRIRARTHNSNAGLPPSSLRLGRLHILVLEQCVHMWQTKLVIVRARIRASTTGTELRTIDS